MPYYCIRDDHGASDHGGDHSDLWCYGNYGIDLSTNLMVSYGSLPGYFAVDRTNQLRKIASFRWKNGNGIVEKRIGGGFQDSGRGAEILVRNVTGGRKK